MIGSESEEGVFLGGRPTKDGLAPRLYVKTNGVTGRFTGSFKKWVIFERISRCGLVCWRKRVMWDRKSRLLGENRLLMPVNTSFRILCDRGKAGWCK